MMDLKIGIVGIDRQSTDICLKYIKHQILAKRKYKMIESKKDCVGYNEYCRIKLDDKDDVDIIIEVCPYTEKSRGKRYDLLVVEDICYCHKLWKDSLLYYCVNPLESRIVYYKINPTGGKLKWNLI